MSGPTKADIVKPHGYADMTGIVDDWCKGLWAFIPYPERKMLVDSILTELGRYRAALEAIAALPELSSDVSRATTIAAAALGRTHGEEG